MAKPKQETWLDYLQNCSYRTSLSDTVKARFVDHIVSLNQHFLALFYQSVPMVYLLDYTTGKYLTMSETSKAVLGFANKEFTENGVGMILDLYEKSHLKLFDAQIFPDRLEVLKNIPPAEHPDYLFTYNLSIKSRQGNYVNLLQRNVFIVSDEKGNPLISAGLVINIDCYRQQNPVLQTIEKIEPTLSSPPESIFKKSYYLQSQDQQFSKREKEILLWMAEGLTSKEIADKLFISEATVIVHRKSMLYKTGKPNVAALIAYALRNGVI